MNESIETTGRTVEKAVAAALEKLAIDRKQAHVEVLAEPSRGLLGLFGQRLAKVRVSVRHTKAEYARSFIAEVARHLGVDVTVSVEEQPDLIRVVIGGSGVGLMIGRRGITLDALEYLVNVAARRRSGDRKTIVVDVDGYRNRRQQVLERIARRAVERVRRTGRRVALEPMGSAERRIIHLAVDGYSGVTTISEGNEPFRRVIIIPAASRSTGSFGNG